MKRQTVQAEHVFWFLYLSLLCAFLLLITIAYAKRNSTSAVSLDTLTVGNPSALSYHVDSITVENRKIKVVGWAVQKGVLYPYFNYGLDESGTGSYAKMQIACLNQDSGKLLLFPTQLQNLPDAEMTIADGSKYPYSSFVAYIPIRMLGRAGQDKLAFCFYDPEDDKIVYFTEITIIDEQRKTY